VLLSLAAAAVLQRMDFSRDSTTAVLQRPAPPLSLSLQLRPSIAVVRQSAIVILCALDHDEPNVVVAAAGSDKLPLDTVFTASKFPAAAVCVRPRPFVTTINFRKPIVCYLPCSLISKPTDSTASQKGVCGRGFDEHKHQKEKI